MGKDRNENRQNYRRRTSGDEKKEKKRGKWLWGLPSVILLAGLIICLFLLWRSGMQIKRLDSELQKSQAEAELNRQDRSNSETEVEGETELQSETELETESETEPENESESETETESEAEIATADWIENPDFVQNLSDLIEEWEQNGESWSVFYTELNGNRQESIGNEEAMESAGLMKLFVMATVYDALNTKKNLVYPEGETTDSLRDMVERMIRDNDDEAADYLVTAYLGEGQRESGITRVNQYCQDNGFKDTLFNHLFTETAENEEHENRSSVRDCTALLRNIYEDSKTDGSNGFRMLRSIKLEKSEEAQSGIPKGILDVSEDYLVYNVLGSGQDPSVGGEIAVVENADGEGCYLLCIMGENLSTQLGTEKISRIAAMSQKYWLSNLQTDSESDGADDYRGSRTADNG